MRLHKFSEAVRKKRIHPFVLGLGSLSIGEKEGSFEKVESGFGTVSEYDFPAFDGVKLDQAGVSGLIFSEL